MEQFQITQNKISVCRLHRQNDTKQYAMQVFAQRALRPSTILLQYNVGRLPFIVHHYVLDAVCLDRLTEPICMRGCM